MNSVRLATLAGARAGGINVWWGHPRRDEFLAAADAAHIDGSPFLRTVYEWWDAELLDAEHPARLEMARSAGSID